MDQDTLDVLAGVAIPSAAIIISTLVAVNLAKTEREAAARARAEEREQVAFDRRGDRVDEAFARALGALAIFNTINLRAERIAEPHRELRVALMLLESAHHSGQSAVPGRWFEAERLAGAAQAGIAMQKLSTVPEILSTEVEVEAIIEAGAPLNTWARDFAQNLRVWRRDSASDEVIESLTENAKRLH